MRGKLIYASVPYIPLFDIVGVGEINCRVNSNNENARNLCGIGILQNVSVNISPWELSKQRGPWPCDLQENFGKGNGDSDQKTDLHGNENDSEEGSHASDKVKFVDLPDELHGLEIDQANHCRNDDGSENGVGRVLEEGGNEFQSEKDHQRHDDV